MSDGLASGAIFSWQQSGPGERKRKEHEHLEYAGVLSEGTLGSTEKNDDSW